MKRMFKTAKYLGFLALMLNLSSCKDFLKEEVYSQLAPENYLNTKEGLTSVLYEAYAKGANMNSNNSIYVLGPQEFSTDILYQSGDNVEATIKNYRDFNWDPTMDFLIQNWDSRSEEHTSELQSRENLVCRLLLEKKSRISAR